MKTSDGYRFGLQFRELSDAHRQVGAFLESLGNKKSAVVVTALIEYLHAHPEAIGGDKPASVVVTYGFSEAELNARIEAAVRRLAGESGSRVPAPIQSDDEASGDNPLAIDTLLDGLDQFS